MKTVKMFVGMAVFAAVVVMLVVGSVRAGDLTPPDGAPGSSMKTLDQVEARIPLSGPLPIVINSPGSYYLTGNLSLATLNTNGITISSNNVTLDLNGYTLTGPGKAAGSSGTGITSAGGSPTNISIRNGTILDWRNRGVGARFVNSQFEFLRVQNNGGSGINTGENCRVSNNTFYQNENGIYVGFDGCIVTGNVCHSNTSDGIYAYSGTVTGNTCLNNGGYGISVVSDSTITGNTCVVNTGDGIRIAYRCRVAENTCNGNGYTTGDAAGIHATGAGNAILANHCVGNDRGLDIDSATNYSSQNTLNGNTTNEDLGGSTEGAGDLANVTF